MFHPNKFVSDEYSVSDKIWLFKWLYYGFRCFGFKSVSVLQGSSSNSRRATSHSGSPDSDCMTEYSTTSEPTTAAQRARQRFVGAGCSSGIGGGSRKDPLTFFTIYNIWYLLYSKLIVFDRHLVPADIIGQNASFARYRRIQNWPKRPIFGISANFYRPKRYFCQISLPRKKKSYFGRTLQINSFCSGNSCGTASGCGSGSGGGGGGGGTSAGVKRDAQLRQKLRERGRFCRS